MKTKLYKNALLLGLILTITFFVFIFLHFCENNSIKSRKPFNFYYDKIIFKDDTECLSQKEQEVCVSPRVDYIDNVSFEDTITIFSASGKKGYISTNTAKVIIPAIYDYVWSFDTSSGIAAVVLDGKLGYIKKDGTYVCYPSFPYKESYYQGIKFIFCNGFGLIPDALTGKFGVIDTSGKIVLPAVYDRIEHTYYDDFIFLYRNGKKGIANKQYKIIINPIHDEIEECPEGFMITDLKPFKRVYISKDLKTIISDKVFDSIEKIYIENHVAKDVVEEDVDILLTESGYSKYTYGSYVGLLNDKTGEIITPAVWDNISWHSEGKFMAQINDCVFLINDKGEIIIK